MRPGAKVAERFEIERLAGSGGMGSIYRARDLQGAAPVALKVLHPESAQEEERFEREARILSELRHPGIVRYIAHGVTSTRQHYLAIEWLEGEDLSERIAKTRLDAAGAITLLKRLAGALGAAHERGIVHRDIKPSNIFLPGGALEEAKILDFGIARVGFMSWDQGNSPPNPDRIGTSTGVTLGTPGYMAPEQARGDHRVDARADVFSLACVIFDCLAGRPPFVGDHAMAILAKIVVEAPPRLRELCPAVPPDLDDLVAWMLEKDPEARPRDGNEVLQGASQMSAAVGGDAHREVGGETRRMMSQPEITAGEQRLLSVVLVSGPLARAARDDGATSDAAGQPSPLASSTRSDPAARIDPVVHTTVETFGGRLEVLADASYLVTLGEERAAEPGSPMQRGWSAARAATDQAAQAARCALALSVLLPPEAAIALATGPGMASGRWPVGQVIDRAAALLRAELQERPARPEEGRADAPWSRRNIRIDDATAGLLDARFEVGRVPAPGAGRGGRSTTGGQAVLWAERPQAEWVRTLLGKPTPCVGRERQLKVLASLFAACVSEPKSLAVLIKAPAGVGKSRLLREFLRSLSEPGAAVRGAPIAASIEGDTVERAPYDADEDEARVDRADGEPERDDADVQGAPRRGLPTPEVWIGCGDPMRSGSPFGLLGAAVRAATAIQDGEPLAVRQQKLRLRIARNVPPPEQDRVTEFLGEMVGAPFSEEESAQPVQLRAARGDAVLMGDQMRRAWEDFVSAECAEKPLIIVLEDLHWGDLPTVRYIDAALRTSQDSPLMVLALGRPEVAQLFPELWAGRNVMELRLGELSRKASELLVREVLGADVNAETVSRIAERAAGNAFYLEELIRAVAGGNAEGLSESVLAMTHARLDGIEPAGRRLLRAASVFGEAFWRGGLAALLGGAHGAVDIDAWLPELVHREVIERRPGSRFPGEDEYAFRHALLREAAYATLTGSDRLLGHRLAGAWLEQTGELDALALAEHFDRGGEPARSVRWLLRGAEQALEGGDLAAAIACAERGARHQDRSARLGEGELDADSGAASSARTDEVLGALRLIQAEAHRWRGEFEEAQRCAVQAARRLERGTLLWLRAADEVMSASGRRGDYMLTTAWTKEIGAYGDALQRVASADEAPDREEIRAVRVIALCSGARQLFHAGQYAAANALITYVTTLAGDLSKLEPRAAAEVHRLSGARARHIGDLAADMTGYAAALDAFERAGDVRNACNARVSLGFAYIEVGDFDRAGEMLNAALAAANRMGLRTVSTRARQNLGLVLAARGQLDEALALERQVIIESRDQGNLRFEGCTRIYAALIAHRAGDFAAAEVDARDAADILEVAPPARAGALAILARALTAEGRIEEAVTAAHAAVNILVKYGGIEEFESLVLVAFVEAARAAGDHEGARTAVVAARERLLTRAAAIPDPAWRETFLHRVRENAMLLSLARICLGDAALPGATRSSSRP